MHSLKPRNQNLTLKPRLNPQTTLWSSEDRPQCPHNTRMSSFVSNEALVTQPKICAHTNTDLFLFQLLLHSPAMHIDPYLKYYQAPLIMISTHILSGLTCFRHTKATCTQAAWRKTSNGGGKKRNRYFKQKKEKKERAQVLTSRAAHICCYLCVIFPLQILIFLSESGGGLRSAHQTVTWGPNHINQSLEWSFLNWWNNESTSVPYLRFKLLMENCEKQSRGREVKKKKHSKNKPHTSRLENWETFTDLFLSLSYYMVVILVVHVTFLSSNSYSSHIHVSALCCWIMLCHRFRIKLLWKKTKITRDFVFMLWSDPTLSRWL